MLICVFQILTYYVYITFQPKGGINVATHLIRKLLVSRHTHDSINFVVGKPWVIGVWQLKKKGNQQKFGLVTVSPPTWLYLCRRLEVEGRLFLGELRYTTDPIAPFPINFIYMP